MAYSLENARLFNETKEALEQQTATAEVLRVINSSPSDLEPVYRTILERITRLCESQIGALFLFDGERLSAAASHGTTGEFAEILRRGRPKPSHETATRLAALERRTVHVTDLLSDATFAPTPRDLYERENVRTVLSVPMLRDNTLIGVITTWRREVRPFDERQIALIRTFADQAVIAIENVRLFNETREALERQTATAEILRVISDSPTDVKPVLTAVAERAARICQAKFADIILRDGDAMQVAAYVGELGRPVGQALPLDRSTVMGRSIVDGATVHVADLQCADGDYPEGSELARQYGHRTTLAVPLVREGHALGTILVRRTEVRPFEKKHVELLATFADQAAIAIQNVRLFNETKEALEQQKASAEVLRVISGSVEDAKPVFDAVAEACERLFAGQFVGVNLIDEGGGLCLAASRYPTGIEFDRDALAQHFATAPTRTGGTRLKLRAAVVDFPDIDQPGVPDEVVAACRIAHARSIAFAPMVLAGKGIGALWVARAAPGSMADKDKALFKTFADQAVIAIQNARLFNETKEALEQQTATAEVLRVISDSPTDVQPVFDTIVRRALQLCDGLFANLFRYDGEQLHFVASQNLIPDQLEILRANYPMRPNASQVSGRVVLNRAIVRMEDVLADPGYDKRFVLAGLWRRMLGVPLLREGRILGAIVVGWKQAGPIEAGHELLLTTFAEQAAIAIENVRLFNETQEALERQTATAEILKVIAGSPADVQPVFERILESQADLDSRGRRSSSAPAMVDRLLLLIRGPLFSRSGGSVAAFKQTADPS